MQYRVFSLLFFLVLAMGMSEERVEIGLAPLLIQSPSHDFNKKLEEQSWGQLVFEQAIEKSHPRISVYSATDKRYFAIARVHDIWYWECKAIRNPDFPETVEALLARVDLHFMIVDTQRQRVVARDTVSGCAAIDKSKAGNDIQTELYLKAFSACVQHAAVEISNKFPIAATVRAVRGVAIDVNLAISGWLREKDVLEIFDEEGELLCSTTFFENTHYGFRSVYKGTTSPPLHQDTEIWIRKKPTPRSPVKQLEQKAVEKAVYARLVEKKDADPLNLLATNGDNLLHAAFKKRQLKRGEKIELYLDWTHDAPKSWYAYLINVDCEGQIIMYFPNNLGKKKKYRTIHLVPGKRRIFPGKGWGIRKLSATIPDGKDSCHDRYVLLVAQNKIPTIEQKLHLAAESGLRLASFTFTDLSAIVKDLAGRRWSGVVLKLEIVK